MARVLGIGGVFFKSEDPDGLGRWYADCLGVPLEEAWGGANFMPDNLPEGSYSVWSPFKSDTNYFAPSKQAFMVNLIVDDVAEALDQISKHGGKVVGEIVQEIYGTFGWFLDPEGNKVELWTPNPSGLTSD